MYFAEGAERPESQLIPLEKLTQFVSYARANIHPELGDDAAQALAEAYVKMRKVGQAANRAVITATPRQLVGETLCAITITISDCHHHLLFSQESLIRLSEGLAKMRLSNLVSAEDVHEAVRLMDVSTGQSATDPVTGIVDIDMFTTGLTSTARREISLQ